MTKKQDTKLSKHAKKKTVHLCAKTVETLMLGSKDRKHGKMQLKTDVHVTRTKQSSGSSIIFKSN